MPKWIPTSEKMPEAGLRVPFLYKKGRNLFLGFGYFNGSKIWVNESECGALGLVTDYFIKLGKVKYWSKVPEFPKG